MAGLLFGHCNHYCNHCVPSFSFQKHTSTWWSDGGLEIGTLQAILKRSGQGARLQPDVKMLPTREDVGRAITAEEEAALLQACGKSRSRSLVPFVTLAIETGARFGVVRTLQWGSVDFENRCLRWGRDKMASGTGRILR